MRRAITSGATWTCKSQPPSTASQASSVTAMGASKVSVAIVWFEGGRIAIVASLPAEGARRSRDADAAALAEIDELFKQVEPSLVLWRPCRAPEFFFDEQTQFWFPGEDFLPASTIPQGCK